MRSRRLHAPHGQNIIWQKCQTRDCTRSSVIITADMNGCNEKWRHRHRSNGRRAVKSRDGRANAHSLSRSDLRFADTRSFINHGAWLMTDEYDRDQASSDCYPRAFARLIPFNGVDCEREVSHWKLIQCTANWNWSQLQNWINKKTWGMHLIFCEQLNMHHSQNLSQTC